MQSPAIRCEGTVIDRLSGAPVPAALVEAWDAEQKFPEVLACALTDKLGKFALAFEPSLLEKAFAGRPHKVALKLFIKGTRVAFTPSEDILLTHEMKPLVLTVKVPQAYAGDNIYQHLPPDLRAELEGLKQHGAKVLARLQDENAKQAFLQNPAQVLTEMGIALSPQLRQRLATQPPPQNVLTPRAFRLLNGQIITPKIKINFTAGKGDTHGR